MQDDSAEKENIDSFCEIIENADISMIWKENNTFIYKHNESSNAELKKDYILSKLQKMKNVSLDVKENSDTDVLKQKENIISFVLSEELYSEYGQLTDDELCPQDNQEPEMITLIKLLINPEYGSTYNMLQAVYKKLLHCDWDKKPVMKAYNITAKSCIHYILIIFGEKQIDFLPLSDPVYAIHTIFMFPSR